AGGRAVAARVRRPGDRPAGRPATERDVQHRAGGAGRRRRRRADAVEGGRRPPLPRQGRRPQPCLLPRLTPSGKSYRVAVLPLLPPPPWWGADASSHTACNGVGSRVDGPPRGGHTREGVISPPPPPGPGPGPF